MVKLTTTAVTISKVDRATSLCVAGSVTLCESEC